MLSHSLASSPACVPSLCADCVDRCVDWLRHADLTSTSPSLSLVRTGGKRSTPLRHKGVTTDRAAVAQDLQNRAAPRRLPAPRKAHFGSHDSETPKCRLGRKSPFGLRMQQSQCSSSGRSHPTQPAVEVQMLAGLNEVADDYKVWLLDQFGVLHDGRKAYPGAIEAVERLAGTGAQLLIISNSSKRASVTMAKLGPLGFNPKWFVGAITSGELTHQYLLERSDPFFSSLGHKCVHFTWSARQAVSTHGSGLTVVQNPEDADFILAHGSEAIGVAGPRAGGENDLDPPAIPAPLSEMEDVMLRAAKKGIPMIVANPDEVTVDGRDLQIMPGTLGRIYERMGGHVQWMGKPDPVIYLAAKSMLGADLQSVVAVGDSLHHDIGGAAAAGIDSIFIAGGIHAADLKIDEFGGMPEPHRLKDLLTETSARTPKFCLPLFN